MKNNSQLIIYQTEDGRTKLDVRLENETVWLTQKLMAVLFQTTVPNINMHLKSIFEESELTKESTCKEFLQVQKESNREVKRKQKFCNLDVIISLLGMQSYDKEANISVRRNDVSIADDLYFYPRLNASLSSQVHC